MSLTKRFQAGDYLFRQGEKSGAMYVLLTGTLTVSARGETIATVKDPGSFVGELSFLTGKPRSADVKAETECKVLSVEDVERFFKEDSRHAVAVAKEIARRLDSLNGKFLEMKRLARSPHVGEGTINEVVKVLCSDDEGDSTVVSSRLV